jgi:SEC-C motif
MTKIGRNQPCFCGSGKKFKKCHGAYLASDETWLPPEARIDIDQKRRGLEALRVRREKQQGLGRPIIAFKARDHQLVAVGGRLHYSKNWKTFHDFLRDFLFGLLSKEWLDAERIKPASERHPILRWFYQASEDSQRSATKHGDIYSAPMTGATRAFINLAYNVYLVAHHTEGDEVVRGYIARLKGRGPGIFAGALFETYAAAAFLKAGFKLEFENEKDGSASHVEFTATYPKTAKNFSVEVKARERSLVKPVDIEDSVDDVKRLRVANKLNKALGKEAAHTRVVMIEINVPDVVTSSEGWPTSALKQISDNERTKFHGGAAKPSAYVFVTNHAFHNNLSVADTGMQVLATGFHIPDFGPHARHASYRGVLDARERHVEMFALMKSIETHYEIPSTFDGAIPELTFQTTEALPRLQFGRWYLVPMKDGREVPGRLYEASVMESEKKAYGCYELVTGEHIMATCPISDEELAAYKRYPDTFFGEVRHPTRRTKTLVDLCDFFYETYKNTSREKALEWMVGAPDYEYLKTLSQQDLAIVLCERWAWNAFNSGARELTTAAV